MMSLPNWLDRYRAGQRNRVWHELRQLGGEVREPGLREEAQLVCDEMARRARQNVEVIIGRLSSAGYPLSLQRPCARSRDTPRPVGSRGGSAHRLAGRAFRAGAHDPAFLGSAGRGRLAGRHAPAVGRVGIS
jgi:hypothetical protein